MVMVYLALRPLSLFIHEEPICFCRRLAFGGHEVVARQGWRFAPKYFAQAIDFLHFALINQASSSSQ